MEHLLLLIVLVLLPLVPEPCSVDTVRVRSDQGDDDCDHDDEGAPTYRPPPNRCALAFSCSGSG